MAELFSIPSKAVIRHLPPFIWSFEMLTLGEISLCVRNLVTLRLWGTLRQICGGIMERRRFPVSQSWSNHPRPGTRDMSEEAIMDVLDHSRKTEEIKQQKKTMAARHQLSCLSHLQLLAPA